MAQDVIRDHSCPQDDAVTRLQRAIFIHMYGEKAWTELTFIDERAHCRRLAELAEEMFRERWTPLTAAVFLTNHTCELLFGSIIPGSRVRELVQDYAESYLEDACKNFMGDGRIRPEMFTTPKERM